MIAGLITVALFALAIALLAEPRVRHQPLRVRRHGRTREGRRPMRAIVGGGAAGAAIAVLILTVGITAAAWIAIVLAVAAIVLGCVDYVRSHG